MWQRLKDYFQLNPREARGLGVLLVLILIIQIGIIFIDELLPSPQPVWTFEWLPAQDEDTEEFIAKGIASKSPKIKFTPFALDLNSATIDDLQATGLSYRQANTFIKYRNRGGKFFTFQDVKKIYGLSDEWLTTMKPYLVYPNVKKLNNEIAELITEPFDPNTADSITLFGVGYKPWQIVNIDKFRKRGGVFHEKEDLLKLYNVDSSHYYQIQDFITISKIKKPTLTQIEINSADSVTLIKVRGIGPTTASRILELKQQCGGIANLNQLFDIYGMDTSRFEQIIEQIEIDISHIKKININKATVSELASHPYISLAYATEIVNFRKKFRFYANIEDINKLSLAQPELFTKLAPYLTTGN